MNIAAISLTDHDCSLCIIKDGEIYENILEERLSTTKRDGDFFFLSAQLSKFEREYGLDKIYIANGNEEDLKLVELYLEKYHVRCPVEYILEEHHLYHASSAYYSSGFDEAICLVMDGWGANHQLIDIFHILGEVNDDNIDDLSSYSEVVFSETTSVYFVKNNSFKTIYKNYLIHPGSNESSSQYEDISKEYLLTIAESNLVDINPCTDIGVMYGTITDHLGFDRHDSGKTMGLAAYGKEDPELPSFLNDTKLFGNSNLFYQARLFNWTYHPHLLHDDDLQRKANIAYKLQRSVEDAIVLRVGKILEKYPNTKNLAFSGGVALNICANSAIKKAYPDLNIFIVPIASDACQAYGMAKFYYYKYNKEIKNESLKTIYMGPNYNLKLKKMEIELTVAKENKKRYNNFKTKV